MTETPQQRRNRRFLWFSAWAIFIGGLIVVLTYEG
jgi:hypothetical protein